MKKHCDACGCDPCDCGWGNYIYSTLTPKCERCGMEINYCECHWGDRINNKKEKNVKKQIKTNDKRIRKSYDQTNIARRNI